tara:strand:+ start:10896 stop:11129 length:234 start_codon:yes stop_codon:yes gene_type:complete
MKKLLVGLSLIAAFAVIGCKNETKEVETSKEVALTEYQCPMKCEGDKTYTDKDTKCPVCGMKLKEVEHVEVHADHEN